MALTGGADSRHAPLPDTGGLISSAEVGIVPLPPRPPRPAAGFSSGGGILPEETGRARLVAACTRRGVGRWSFGPTRRAPSSGGRWRRERAPPIRDIDVLVLMVAGAASEQDPDRVDAVVGAGEHQGVWPHSDSRVGVGAVVSSRATTSRCGGRGGCSG
jgi:hypothetical protein